MYEIAIGYVNELFFSQVTRGRHLMIYIHVSATSYAILPNPLLSTSTPSSSCNHEHCTAASGPEPQLDEPLHYSSQGWRGPDLPINTDMCIQDTSACLVTIGDHPSGM